MTRQSGNPIFVRDGQPTVPLKNYRLGQNGLSDDRREAWLQKLVYDQPEIIPMREIEPAFEPLISICMELPTESGSVDNVWMTPKGGLILGECKLIRNPQSRREVIAQALDYARAVTGWHFDDLQKAVQRARKEPSSTLWDLINRPDYPSDLEEHEFVEAVERRLRFGRIMLLVISDGLHEGAEALASFLQLHAGVHAGLALLDLSIWEGIDGGHIVLPRVPLRTEIVERGIVTINDPNIVISAPTPTGAKAATASEPEFYLQLEQRLPELSTSLRTFVASLKDLGVEAEYGKSLFLRGRTPEGDPLSIGTIEPYGSVWLLKSISDAKAAGNQTAAIQYLEAIASILGGTVKRYENGSIDVRGPDEKSVRLPALLSKEAAWREAIKEFISAFSSSDSSR
jgi:hypothetical protein